MDPRSTNRSQRPTGHDIGASEPGQDSIYWEVTSSIYGRGTILFGSAGKDFVVIIAPPSVPLPTPPDWKAPLASSGWRAAWMMRIADGRIVIDEQEPVDLKEMSFAEVVGFVLEHCPTYLLWLSQQVTMRARTTAFTLQRDRNGVLPPGSAHREAAIVGMLADAEEALAIHSSHLKRIPECPLDTAWLDHLRRTISPVIDRVLLPGSGCSS